MKKKYRQKQKGVFFSPLNKHHSAASDVNVYESAQREKLRCDLLSRQHRKHLSLHRMFKQIHSLFSHPFRLQTHSQTHKQTHTQANTHIHTHIHTRMHSDTQKNALKDTHTDTYTYTHSHTHIRIYTHTLRKTHKLTYQCIKHSVLTLDFLHVFRKRKF